MKPLFLPNSKSVMDCVSQDAIWSRILPGVERLAKLESDLQASLPPGLGHRVRAASLADDTLVIAVFSSSLATKLRQTIPRVKSGLESRGWKVSAIQLRVQPEDFAAKSAGYANRPKKAVVTPQAREALGKLASSLDEGDLKRAIERLSSRS
jgi:hypothetical protein